MNHTTALTNDDKAARSAEHFLLHERAYRLGILPTEQPHPLTTGISAILEHDTTAGLRALQSVDDDLPPVLERTLRGPEFRRLADAMREALVAGRRVFFTGCGATGRLSILLEASWRRFWRGVDDPRAAACGDRVRSVMAGGDFALIRSVEGFEDFTDFGRHQLREAGVAPGDVVVAITEGGETPFVIGTAWEALEAGASSFFVFNNPAEVLVEHVQRSREVIQEPRITKLDLATGPMAIAGSTRMQATTIELLVVGIALEHALAALLGDQGIAPPSGASPAPLNDAPAVFRQLLGTLGDDANLTAMAGLVEHEARVYRAAGLVTYFATDYLLDVMTDTTERSPTFSLPPFREVGDESSARSWSFVKHPLRDTPGAWRDMLGRDPGGIDWTGETYAAMGAPANLCENPPVLDRDRILRFAIGNEADASRTDAPHSLAVTLLVGKEVEIYADPRSGLCRQLVPRIGAFEQRAVLSVGPDAARAGDDEALYAVRCALPPTPLRLWHHVAAKLVLNTVSTASMGLLGRLAGNWMVYVNTSNKKLIDRGVRLIADQAGVPYDEACHALFVTLHQPGAAQMVGRHASSPVAATIARLKRSGSA